MATPSQPIIYRRPLTLSNSVELYWYPPVSDGGNVITSYIIECANIPYINVLPATYRKSIVSNLTIGNTYYFTIKATNVNGNGTIADFNFIIPGFKPENPSNLSISNDLSNIYFSLTNPSNIGNSSLTYNVVTFSPLDIYGNVSNISAFTYNQSSYGSNIIDPLNTKFLNSNLNYKCYIQSTNTVNDSDKNFFDSYINTKIPTNGLKLWLDPCDRSTLTISNSIVTKLIDKSGNKSNATIIQAYGPSYDSSNCLLNFNGLQYLTLPDNTIPSGNTSYSIFMYVSTSNISRNGQWFLHSGTPTPNLFLGGLINSNTVVHSWFGNQQVSNTNISSNISYLVEFTYDSGIRKSFINGSLVGLENISPRNSTVSNNLIGTNSNLTANLVGSIGDVIIYNRLLSDTERNSVKNYLEIKKQNVSLQNVGNLISWLDATDSSSIWNGNLESKIDYGSKVNNWLDRSSANNNATQSNISILPTRRPFTQNNLDTLEFNQSYLTIPSASYPIDAFMILKLSNITDQNGILGIGPSSNNYNSLSYVSGNKWSIDATSNSIISSSAETSSNFLLMEWSIGNNNNYIRRYGSNIANTTTGTWTLPNNSNIYIGNPNGFDFSKRFKGYIGEMMIFNKQLEDGFRYPIEGYLAWKWGLQSNLPSDHPYRNSAPYLFYKYMSISSNSNVVVSNIFIPSYISGLKGWYDANDTSNVLTTGSNVYQWNDKTSFNNNFNQTTSTKQPMYDNSTKSIIFDGVDDTLSGPFNGNIFSSTSSFFVFLVGTPISTNTNDSNPWGNDAMIGDFGGYQSLFFKPNTVGTYYYDSNNITRQVTQNYTTGSRTLFGYGLQSNIFLLDVNGNISNISVTLPIKVTDSSFEFGTQYSGWVTTGYMNCRFNEVLFYDFINTFNRQQIEGYLAWKWGLQSNLPSTHPFKYAAPTIDFNPLSISGLSLWLDGNDPNGTSIIPANGSTINTWYDKSNNSRSATTRVGTITYDLTNKGLVFNGSSSYNSSLSASTNIETVLIVADISNLGAINTFMGGTDTGTNGARQFRHYNSKIETVKQYIASTLMTSFTPIINTKFLTGFNNNGSLLIHYANGTNIGSTSSVSYTSGLTTIIGGLFANSTNSEFFNGKIYEILSFNRSLATSEFQRVEGYLAWKWGLQSNLPSIHPFKTFAPTGVFAPNYIGNLSFWLDATKITNYTNGQTLTSWNDISRNNYSSSSAAYPTYQTNALNYKPVVRFNGSSQYLDFGNVLNIGSSTGITIFSVVNYNSTGDGGIIAKSLYGAALSRWALVRGSWTSANSMTFFVSSSTNTATAPEAYYSDATTGGRMISAVWDRSNLYNYKNGTQMSTASLSDSGTYTNSYNLFVGAYGNESGTSPRAGSYLNGDIGEVLVYLQPLSTTDRQTIEGYLAWKWGLQGSLASNHPYKNFAP